ncbi:rod shape-determining protein [Dactylosporangium sp. NPDC049140]|uniref:rod shape-determining protein n=1 Tax=Dactylosporangium sp. NPDC049140 TaxID=3155647 RepID=UPI0033E60DD8
MPTSTREPERSGRVDVPITDGAARVSGTPPRIHATTRPAAVAVDLGSGRTRIWASGQPVLSAPTFSDSLMNPSRLVHRGRIADPAGYERLLTRLLRRYHRPLPAGAVVVACRPVLATADDEAAVRRLLTAVFAPSRLLFIDSIRAAAIGVGATPGVLLVADVGAQLTEVAVLTGGGVAAARRADIGVADLIRPTELDPIVHTIIDLVDDLRRDPRCQDVTDAMTRRGLLLVGGAAGPQLAARAAGAMGMAARAATRPRIVAVRGAGLAALAALRRAAMTAT